MYRIRVFLDVKERNLILFKRSSHQYTFQLVLRLYLDSFHSFKIEKKEMNNITQQWSSFMIIKYLLYLGYPHSRTALDLIYSYRFSTWDIFCDKAR